MTLICRTLLTALLVCQVDVAAAQYQIEFKVECHDGSNWNTITGPTPVALPVAAEEGASCPTANTTTTSCPSAPAPSTTPATWSVLDSTMVTLPFDPSTLDEGVYRVGVRAREGVGPFGCWSFQHLPITRVDWVIDRAEYCWDDATTWSLLSAAPAPTTAMGCPVPAGRGHFEANVSTAGLAPGMHVFHTRVRERHPTDASRFRWSTTRSREVWIAGVELGVTGATLFHPDFCATPATPGTTSGWARLEAVDSTPGGVVLQSNPCIDPQDSPVGATMTSGLFGDTCLRFDGCDLSDTTCGVDFALGREAPQNPAALVTVNAPMTPQVGNHVEVEFTWTIPPLSLFGSFEVQQEDGTPLGSTSAGSTSLTITLDPGEYADLRVAGITTHPGVADGIHYRSLPLSLVVPGFVIESVDYDQSSDSYLICWRDPNPGAVYSGFTVSYINSMDTVVTVPGVLATPNSGCVLLFGSDFDRCVSPLLVSGLDAQGTPLASTSLQIDAASCAGPLFRRGDCNDDATINIADAVFLLAALFTAGSPPSCELACDANDDENVNIGDTVYLLGALFGSGNVLAAPGTICGVDGTPGMLSCAQSTHCP